MARACVESLVRVAVREVGDTESDEDAFDRTSRPVLAQKLEETLPRGAVDRLVRILRGVAAGGVDEDGVVGEKPVAVAGAADPANGEIAHFVGQRELEARVGESGGLSRSRRADDDVPRQLIQIAAVAPAAEPRLAQGRQGIAEAVFQPFCLLSRHCRGRSLDGLRRLPHQAVDHRPVPPALPKGAGGDEDRPR